MSCWANGGAGIQFFTVHRYREHSRKYGAWRVLGKDVSSFLVVENHLKKKKNLKEDHVTDGNQAMQRKAVQTTARELGVEAV